MIIRSVWIVKLLTIYSMKISSLSGLFLSQVHKFVVVLIQIYSASEKHRSLGFIAHGWNQEFLKGGGSKTTLKAPPTIYM